MISCRELVDFLMDYLDGALAEEERGAFERHLEVCPWCVAYLRSYRETVRLGRAALQRSEAPVPGDVPDDLVKAILAARRS